MENSSIIKDLTQGSVLRNLITFSIPMMLANIIQITYNLVDMVVVGQVVGSAGLSAVSNGGDIIQLLTMICMGFALAGQVLASQMVGQKDAEGISRAIGTIFTVNIACAIALMIAGFIALDAMLTVINVPQEAYAGAMQYSQVCLGGLVFIFGYNTVSAILRGMGDSKTPFVIVAIAAVLNLLLDLLFVAGFGWEVWGAALATVIGQAVSCIAAIVYLYKKKVDFGFDFKLKSFAADAYCLKFLLKLGLPLALEHSAVYISKLFVSSWINSYGLVASAVTGVGTKLTQMSTIVTAALQAAETSMIGQSLGAGKLDRIKKAVYVSLGVGLCFTSILSIISVLFPVQIFRIFSQDSEVLAMAPNYMLVAIVTYSAYALRMPMTGLINGLGNGKLAMLLGLLDGIVIRTGLAVLLGVYFEMGVMGFWLGNALAGYSPFVVVGIYFWSGKWKRRANNWQGSADIQKAN